MYLSIVLILNINIASSHSAVQQKQTILTQTYVFTYVLLFLFTILIAKAGLGGFYFVTLWNIGVLLAIVAGAFLEGAGMGVGYPEVIHDADGNNGDGHSENHHTESSDAHRESEPQPTESTPLMVRQRQPNNDALSTWSGSWCWIVQLLFVVPVPVILVSHIAVFTMGALSQTLADGSSPAIGKSFFVLILIALHTQLAIIYYFPQFMVARRLSRF